MSWAESHYCFKEILALTHPWTHYCPQQATVVQLYSVHQPFAATVRLVHQSGAWLVDNKVKYTVVYCQMHEVIKNVDIRWNSDF